MIVSEAGEYAGYVSNGCVDADDGSPYIDIRLPCGGSVSVVIIPTPNAEIISEICARFEQRKNVSLSFDDGLSFGSALTYAPPLRVIAAGRGENLMMFARAAHSLGIDCAAYSARPS